MLWGARVRLGVLILVFLAVMGSTRSSALAQQRDEVPASVVLLAGSVDGKPAYGCGVIVNERRDSVEIITAGHNLAIGRLELITVAGERLALRSSVRLPNSDLAVLVTERPRRAYEVAELAKETPIGSRVRLWGPIKSQPFTAHVGRVRAIDPRVTDAPDNAVALDCEQCNHGDSGTGIFDDRGRLVAIVTAGYFLEGVKLFVLGENARPRAALAADRP